MADTKKILIVDDDFEVVEFIKAILTTKGYETCVAYDGQEGMEQLAAERPDLVVLDLRMPKMSGMEFCRQARLLEDRDLATTPIIVVSSVATEVDKPEHFWIKGLGCDDFLAKPFDPLALLGRVEYLLRKGGYVSDIPGNGRPSNATPPPFGAAPQPGAATARPAPEPRRPGMAMAGASPEEVVRVFVESWNTRDFVAEFNALGDEMLGGLTCQEYVARRAQLYADEKGDTVKCNVLDMDVDIRGQLATVACLREDLAQGLPRRKDERYTLRRTPTGWKIVNMRSRPMTFNIES